MNQRITETDLVTTLRVRVRFSEMDALRMVWHGNYVTYLEDARERWGEEHGLAYMEMYRNGFVAPLYDLHLQYRGTAAMGDELELKIIYCRATGAKLVFHYEITNTRTSQIILTAESIQLFTDLAGEFCPALPPFYEHWLQQHQLL